MLFNNTAHAGYQFTIKEIKDLMKIDDETCAKNVKSLMFKGFNLLEIRNDPSGGKMTPS
jgi:phage terminase large subunit-like protein